MQAVPEGLPSVCHQHHIQLGTPWLSCCPRGGDLFLGDLNNLLGRDSDSSKQGLAEAQDSGGYRESQVHLKLAPTLSNGLAESQRDSQCARQRGPRV